MYLFAAACVLVGIVGVLLIAYAHSLQNRLSGGHDGARSAPACPSPSSSGMNGTAALSIPGGHAKATPDAPEGMAEPLPPPAGSQTSPALAWARQGGDLDPGMYPTAEGLWARTGELWSDEGFLSLTEDELHDLLALDDGFGFHGPKRITDILGPLPTRADCDLALECEPVRRALEDTCASELSVLALQDVAGRTRNKTAEDQLTIAHSAFRESQDRLFSELDRCGSFKHWTTLWKAWKRWQE